MVEFAVRLERSIYSGQANPAAAIRNTLWGSRQKKRTSDRISLTAARALRSSGVPHAHVSRPITTADLGAWVPSYLRSELLLHFDALQQIPLSVPLLRKYNLPGKSPSIRLGYCLGNASCAFLGDVLALDNPLKINNFGRRTLNELEALLRQLAIMAYGPQSPAPFSASTLFLHFNDFNFRSTDGLLAHSEASAIIRDRLNDPDAQVEILSPSFPVNLLPRLPEDLKIKLAVHLEALKDVPIAKGKGGRYSVLGIPLSARLANFLYNAGFAALEDCLLDTRAMRYMRRPQTFLEFVGVLRQVVDKLDGCK